MRKPALRFLAIASVASATAFLMSTPSALATVYLSAPGLQTESDGYSPTVPLGAGTSILNSYTIPASNGLSKAGPVKKIPVMGMQLIKANKTIDKNSPFLFKALATGKLYAWMLITVTDSRAENRPKVFTACLTNAVVSSMTQAGSPSDPLPTEDLSINYSKIKLNYQHNSLPDVPALVTTVAWDISRSLLQLLPSSAEALTPC